MAFLNGYVAVAGKEPFLPGDPDDTECLLRGFLLDKALYELSYELNNRPDWAGIPLAGIHQLVTDATGKDRR
ncbi:MAG: hypothetical protein U5R31_11265 [Acidimicrobiia bacterium]|nr:hypothetical protein [Acidimicrobiia bacterium]